MATLLIHADVFLDILIFAGVAALLLFDDFVDDPGDGGVFHIYHIEARHVAFERDSQSILKVFVRA